MDCLHPGSINMKKVYFNVRNEYEFLNNYKELQQAFIKVGVARVRAGGGWGRAAMAAMASAPVFGALHRPADVLSVCLTAGLKH